MTPRERISVLCKKAPELLMFYKARVRHYTVETHTINVLNQFERYFSSHFDEMNIEDFRLLLLLHDIGKSVAYKKGNKENQYIETISIISENKKRLNISDYTFSLFKTILENDSLGMYMQGKMSLEAIYDDVVQRAKKIKIKIDELFYLLSVYYQCDVASYTEDAGGIKYLEYLFDYNENLKIYNTKTKLLQFSINYQNRYNNLYNKIKERVDTKATSNIKIIKGNIFNSRLDVIVNTVNCVGVMGKGIALVFKLRYPKMFDLYKEYCLSHLIGIGKLWLYKGEEGVPWVLNFPTKFHWKYPSKMEYIEKGLQKFVETYKEKKIMSIAFPLLGTNNGGLDKQEVLSLMCTYLRKCDIPIEIYEYDASAPDDLFEKFKENWNKIPDNNKKDILTDVNTKGRITQKQIDIINQAVSSDSVKSMITLIESDGIGIKTMEKCFNLVMGLSSR
jgi:hypothetical protein